MSNYSDLKSEINSAIRTNGNNEITGSVLQSVLTRIVGSIGAQFQLVGIAGTNTNPGTPDYNVAYIAGPGTYQYFDNLTIASGRIGVLKYNGTWQVESFALPSGSIVSWSQDIHTGTKIASITINGDVIDVYAPSSDSEVEVFPIQQTGTRIARINVNGVSYDIYAPTGGGGGGDTVVWNQLQQSGLRIATISINGVQTDVYAPSGGGSVVSYVQNQPSGVKIGTITINGTPTDIFVPTASLVSFSQILTGGVPIGVITINGVSTVLYAPTGGGGGGDSNVTYVPAYIPADPDERLLLGTLTIDGAPYQIYAPANFFEVSGNKILLKSTFTGGLNSPIVETEEIASEDSEIYISDPEGYLIAKVTADGIISTKVSAKQMIAPLYKSDDPNGFEVIEDGTPDILISDPNGFVLERLQAGKGFYGSVKNKLITLKSQPALSWIDDDFGIIDNNALRTIYSKLHTWCNNHELYLDFATGIQTGDALTYLLNWEKEGFRYLLHPDHDGWWTGTGGYVWDITKVKRSLVETIRFFKTNGLCSSGKLLVWPGASNSVAENVPIVQKYCECAISVLQGGNYGITNNRYQLQRIKIDDISASKTKSYIKNWIRQSLLNNEWVILYTHLYDVDPSDTVDDTSNTFGNIMDIVSYANSLSRLRSTEEIWDERKIMYNF